MRVVPILSLVAILALALPAPRLAPAQETTATEETERPGGIEAITVTARRVEESIQETPVSVTALSGADLDDQIVENLLDVGYQVPNLTLSQSQATGSTVFVSIRGITTADFTPSVDSGISLYVDGMYLSRTVGMIRDMYDLERVEVLRGPQGTLFGRNTTGGALQFFSKRPDGQFGGEISADFGNYARRETKGAIGFPIAGETLSGRLAWVARQRDNFSRSASSGNDHEFQKTYYLRGSVRWQPTDRIDFTANAHRAKARDGSTNAKLRSFNPQGSLAAFFSTIVQNPAPIDAAFGRPSTPVSDFASGNLRTTNSVGGGLTHNGIGFGEIQDDDTQLYTLNGSIDFDGFTLRSIGGYYRLKARRSSDGDGIPTELFLSADQYDTKAWQQEFQLTGSGLDGRVTWTTGIYYGYEESKNDAIAAVLPEAANLQTVLAGGPCPFGAPANLVETLCFINASSISQQRTKNWSFAPYLSVDFSLTDRLMLTTGLRYTEERRESQYRSTVFQDGVYAGLFPTSSGSGALFAGECTLGTNAAGDVISSDDPTSLQRGSCDPITTKLREDFWTWDSMLRLHWTDSLMTFARVALSRRSGNNAPRPLVAGDLAITSPERLIQYELGVKSQWLDDRLRFNASVFHGNFSDVIVSNIQDVGGRTATISQNAARRYIQGAEIELRTAGLLLPGLSTNLTIGSVNVRAVKDIRTDGLGNRVNYDRIVNGPGVTPRLTYSVGAAYTFPEIDLGRYAGQLTARVDYAWQARTHSFDRTYSRSNPDVQCSGSTPAPLCRGDDARLHRGDKTINGVEVGGGETSDYGLLNASLSYDIPDLNVTLTAWARNILDREYETGWIDFPFGVFTSYQGAPREVGVGLTYRFGAE